MLFDNVDNWLKWKNRDIEEKYGKEFADWAKKNEYKTPRYLIDAGCQTDKEYKEKLSRCSEFA